MRSFHCRSADLVRFSVADNVNIRAHCDESKIFGKNVVLWWLLVLSNLPDRPLGKARKWSCFQMATICAIHIVFELEMYLFGEFR